MPDSVIDCGLLGASSVKESGAVRLPAAPGVNVTPTVHEPPGATVAPLQVFALMAKSAAFVPVIEAAFMCRLAVPLLVTVTVWAVLVVPTP